MAITKVTTIERIECLPPMDSSAENTTNDGNWRLTVFYEDTLDDSSDADLPVTVGRTKHFLRYDDEGNAVDISTETQDVQDVAAALWS